MLNKTKGRNGNSAFSNFIREGSARTKKKVYRAVIADANRDQVNVIRTAEQRDSFNQ